MSQIETIALLMGVSWASGINLYATILVLGLLNSTGYATLPADLQILSEPVVLIAAGFMYCVEFFADKTPGVDTAWDAIHSFIRIPAGAVLAAAAVGELHPAVQLSAFLIGGTVAAGTHATKAGTRVAINTSPEPFSNWIASLSEDVLVIVGLWSALVHPWIFLIAFLVFVMFALWLLPKIWRGVKHLIGMLRNRFRAVGNASAASTARLPPATRSD
jgi:hypothetical protein